MLSSEFNQEMGALIRSLESQVRQHPASVFAESEDVMEHLDRAIVALIAFRMALKKAASRDV